MPKHSATVISGFIVFALAFLWIYYFLDNALWSLAISLPVFILFETVAKAVYMGYEKKRTLPFSELYFRLGVLTTVEQATLFASAMQDCEPTVKGNLIIVIRNNQTIIAACCFKLGDVTADDLLRIKRDVADKQYDRLFVLCKPVPRQVLLTAKRFGFSAEYPDKRQIRDYLKQGNALPPTIKGSVNKQKNPFSVKDFLRSVFTRGKAKYYLFTAVVLGLTAFLVPVTVYYLIFSGICAILSVGCLFAAD